MKTQKSLWMSISYNLFPNNGEVWDYKINIYVSYIVQVGIICSD